MTQVRGDLYVLLDAWPHYTGREITQAFHTQALRFHPDKNPDEEATAQFQKIQDAYAVLSNPESRTDYDLRGVWPDDGTHAQEIGRVTDEAHSYTHHMPPKMPKARRKLVPSPEEYENDIIKPLGRGQGHAWRCDDFELETLYQSSGDKVQATWSPTSQAYLFARPDYHRDPTFAGPQFDDARGSTRPDFHEDPFFANQDIFDFAPPDEGELEEYRRKKWDLEMNCDEARTETAKVSQSSPNRAKYAGTKLVGGAAGGGGGSKFLKLFGVQDKTFITEALPPPQPRAIREAADAARGAHDNRSLAVRQKKGGHVQPAIAFRTFAEEDEEEEELGEDESRKRRQRQQAAEHAAITALGQTPQQRRRAYARKQHQFQHQHQQEHQQEGDDDDDEIPMPSGWKTHDRLKTALAAERAAQQGKGGHARRADGPTAGQRADPAGRAAWQTARAAGRPRAGGERAALDVELAERYRAVWKLQAEQAVPARQALERAEAEVEMEAGARNRCSSRSSSSRIGGGVGASAGTPQDRLQRKTKNKKKHNKKGEAEDEDEELAPRSFNGQQHHQQQQQQQRSLAAVTTTPADDEVGVGLSARELARKQHERAQGRVRAAERAARAAEAQLEQATAREAESRQQQAGRGRTAAVERRKGAGPNVRPLKAKGLKKK
ncbi:hypothetical protein GGR56DRAFT_682078 [Xylariaceae sp. FL0804]|nr:hypothetical protein GGR56DRAFT_682078 [Xylariaceae sp. FL0804]